MKELQSSPIIKLLQRSNSRLNIDLLRSNKSHRLAFDPTLRAALPRLRGATIRHAAMRLFAALPLFPQRKYPLTVIHSVSSGGSMGIAPFFVQTYAEVCTAREWASRTLLPLRIEAMKAAVKLSPAPTVSATSTLGVGWKDTFPGVKTCCR